LRDILLMVLVLVLVVILYFVLPLAIPSIFSIVPGQEIRDQLVRVLGSITSISGTGVV
jgi:hypothetical protein